MNSEKTERVGDILGSPIVKKIEVIDRTVMVVGIKTHVGSWVATEV